ncbi:MAG: hypothetical protein U0163_19835 [Gemmatimonadaceae bacterium]
MTASLRVYVNSRPVEAPEGGTVLDAVRALDPSLAEQVAAGARVVTDSRGLPLDASTPLVVGSIFRVIHARSAAEGQEGES